MKQIIKQNELKLYNKEKEKLNYMKRKNAK